MGLDLRSPLLTLITALPVVLAAAGAHADRLTNNTANFAALDKVTARISKLQVDLNQTSKFGSLKVTPRACYSRDATDEPKTTAFVEVDEVQLDGSEKRIFSGWMFAESPGLNAVEHPVFDVWLTACANPVRAESTKRGPAAPDQPSEPLTRQRPRR
jgi:hypothetical protein